MYKQVRFPPQGCAVTTVVTALNRRGSIDDLDRAIVKLAARINAASHDLLVLIRRFDERARWLRWGFENRADWLRREEVAAGSQSVRYGSRK